MPIGFWKNKEDDNSQTNFISDKTHIRGGIDSESNLHIEGKVDGDIHCKGNVNVTETAIISGKIHGENISIAGSVEGDIYSRGVAEVHVNARLKGDITALGLTIHPGSIFIGKCNIGVKVEAEKSIEEIEDIINEAK